MLTHEIAKAALAHWNLENAPLEEYRYPSSGYLCENCLWVNGKFVLKESPFRGTLEKEAALSEQLTRFGLEAPAFQPCTVSALHGGRRYCGGKGALVLPWPDAEGGGPAGVRNHETGRDCPCPGHWKSHWETASGVAGM